MATNCPICRELARDDRGLCQRCIDKCVHHKTYEPTEEEIYGRLTKEVQATWSESEWLKRGRAGGDDCSGIRVVQTRVDGRRLTTSTEY